MGRIRAQAQPGHPIPGPKFCDVIVYRDDLARAFGAECRREPDRVQTASLVDIEIVDSCRAHPHQQLPRGEIRRRQLLLEEPAWTEFMAVMSDFLGTRADADAPGAFGELTLRERELLELIARGLDNTGIAERLGLQVKTVRNHVTHIYDKLGVRTRAEAIVRAREAGLGGQGADERSSPGTRVPMR